MDLTTVSLPSAEAADYTIMEENGIYPQAPLSPDHNITAGSFPIVLDSDSNLYKRIILGYILPFIVAVTAFLNTVVFFILIKPNMRSSVNVILSGLAMSDTFTGLAALPYYVYFYTFTHDSKYLPHAWCYVQKYCTGVIPTIFHTISVWLTLSLAIQRYIYVCHSLHAKTLCTVSRMIRVVTTIIILSILLHAPRLFDSSFVKVVLYPDNGNENVETCIEVLKSWAEAYQFIYYPIYYWIRLVTIHLIPAIGLTILNLILIAVIRSSSNRRRHLILQNRTREWRKIRETNITTLLLVVVITVFIAVEVPMGVLMLLAILRNQYAYDIGYLDGNSEEILSVTFNCLILLSYPTNFLIYVSMSKKFRSQLCQMTSFRKRSTRVTGSEKTLQTYSKEKSSSVELMRSIFTVTALPLVKDRPTASPTNTIGSVRSIHSSTSSTTKSPSVVTIKENENIVIANKVTAESVDKSSQRLTAVTDDITQSTCCQCQCPICQVQCQQQGTTTSSQTGASLYSDDLELLTGNI